MHFSRSSVGLYGIAAHMKPKVFDLHWVYLRKYPHFIWPWRYTLCRLVPLYLTVFVCMSSQSLDVLPDMLHPAHGPPGSSNANSYHSGRHQAPHFPGVCLLCYGVRFPSRGLVPRIPQSYLTRCFVAFSGLAFCPYGINTHMREISIPLPVREKTYLIWKDRMDLSFR